MAVPPTCPRCGKTARRDVTEVGTFVACAACGFEAAETMTLDFETD